MLSPVFVFSPPPPRKKVADKENAQHRTIRVALGLEHFLRGGPVSWTDLVSRRDDFYGTGSSNSLNNNFYEVIKKTEPGCSQWWITGG